MAVLLPIYAALYAICLLLLLPGDEQPWAMFGIVSGTFVGCVVGGFLILLLTGNALYHHQSFRQDEQGFYQGKRKLAKDNLRTIVPKKILSVCSLAFIPKKNGVWKSYQLQYYFYDVISMATFMVENQILPYVDAETKLWVWITLHTPTVTGKVKAQLAAQLLPCPCCGHFTLLNHDLPLAERCQVCGWANGEEAVNYVTLSQAQLNYQRYGACLLEFVPLVRQPFDYEK